MLVMALVFVLGTFGMNFQITTALMATKEFDKGPAGVRPARLDHGHRLADGSAAVGPAGHGRGCASCWSPSSASRSPAALAALAPSYQLFALALVPVGLSALTALTTANAMVQLAVEPTCAAG